MKTILAVLSLLLSTTLMAAPSPIREDVSLKSEKFSKLIYDSLAAKIKPETVVRVGASQNVVSIKGLLTCTENLKLISGGKIIKTYSCVMIKGAWNELGRDIYSSGDKEALTKKLYSSLSVKELKEEIFVSKTIEFNTPDGHGGTERNQIVCMKPNKEGEQMGLRGTCQLINAM